MTRIIFVCHGNICRSPMAEFVMKALVKEAGRENEFEISSRATSREEIGNDIHYGAQRKMRQMGIVFEHHYATQLTMAEYESADLILVMDSNNYRNTLRLIGSDEQNKVRKLLDYDGGGDIADPWYTGNFDAAYNDILRACKKLLISL